MNRVILRLAGAVLALDLVAGTAGADGPPRASAPRPAPAAPFTWTGLYLGPHLGGALDRSDISNPYGQTLFGDEIRSPGTLAGMQLGYNRQYGALVVGVETDVSWADLDGTFTCLQPIRGQIDVDPSFIGGAFGATCRAGVDWLGTLTGRVGAAVGPDGRMLLYAKGGLAWMHGDVSMATNNIMAGQFGPPAATSSSSFTQWGWTVGTGLEYALAGNWSARLEYDFLRFGSHGVATPLAAPIAQPDFQGIFQSSAPDGRRAGVEQDMHAVKLALNYRFGSGADPRPTPARHRRGRAGARHQCSADRGRRPLRPRLGQVQAGPRGQHRPARQQLAADLEGRRDRRRRGVLASRHAASRHGQGPVGHRHRQQRPHQRRGLGARQGR
ncbi:MAG: outer membrane protein [Hyphomicrobiaceae bacterium]